MKRLVPDCVILGLLALQPAHGYELLERFKTKDQLGRIWNMSTSQLYAVLNRLHEEDSIVGKKLVPKDGPPRTQYTITDKGQSQVDSWLSETNPSTSIHRIRVMFLSRLYIADLLGEPLMGIFDNQISVCQSQSQKLFDKRQISDSWIEKLTLDFVQNQLRAVLNWLEEKKILMT